MNVSKSTKLKLERSWEKILRAFYHGLTVQKRATFGFGPTGDIDTGSLLKNSTASNEMMEKLDKVPIHNLAEKRSIGLVNYGIKIKGKDNITNVSWNVILNKNFDFFLPADALANTKK